MLINKLLFLFIITFFLVSSCKKDMRLFEKDSKTFLTKYGKENTEKEIDIKSYYSALFIHIESVSAPSTASVARHSNFIS